MMATGTETILSLSRISPDMTPLVGQKAATLARLRHAGFDVPDGIVVPATALDAALGAAGLPVNPSPEQVRQLTIPESLERELMAAVERWGEVLLAVRSSGVSEDLPGRSYAGQYDTVLNVRRDVLLDALRTCWASAFAGRIMAYEGGPKAAETGMAALIQPMVAADAAGVAFSANPVTGDRSQVVVSSVRGLGDRLVSGLVSPDEWLVTEGEAMVQASPEQSIDERQAGAVADLARRVERHFGSPQDIEWALGGERLVLLQARPITSLPEPQPTPIPIPAVAPDGYWEREASHFPRPLSPLYRSIQLPAANAGFRRAFEEFGFLVEGVGFREIGGWGYARVVPVGGKDRPAPPAWLLPLLVSVIPEMRRRAKRCVAAIRSDLHGRVVRRWREEWMPEMATRNAQLHEVDLGSLSDVELDTHLQAAVKLFDDGYRIHFALQTALMVALGELAFFCQDELGWTDTETLDLLTGLSPTSTEPARQLEALARLAGSKPALRAVLDGLKPAGRRPTGEEIGRLRTIDAEFADAFVGYLQEFGCRAVNHEAADATLEEDPDLLLGLVRDRLAARAGTTSDAAGLSARRAEARERAQPQLADLSARARFDRILSTAEEAYPIREENEFYTISVPLALVRYAVLEAGRRLADRGPIGRPDDAFFLEMPELRDALRADGSYRELVLRREGERAWVEAHPGAPSFGKNPGPPPSFRKLAPEVRLAMEAVLWTVERTFESDRSAAPRTTNTGALTGIGASPGRYTGPVRIVFDESRLDRVRPGDVLVCPITSPVWSIVFPNVGALVTDTGGILSHPAIIAREYAIPAVVATGNATTRLQDGQMVTVDGTEGVVEPA